MTERDTAVVVLDLLAGMTYNHDGNELGEVYAKQIGRAHV